MAGWALRCPSCLGWRAVELPGCVLCFQGGLHLCQLPWLPRVCPAPSPCLPQVMLTRHGQIKRTLLSQFASINRAGLAAMRVNVGAAEGQGDALVVRKWKLAWNGELERLGEARLPCLQMCALPVLPPGARLYSHLTFMPCVLRLQEGDVLQFVGLASPTDSVLLASSNGYANHMRVDLVRRMSRAAAGVKVCWLCCMRRCSFVVPAFRRLALFVRGGRQGCLAACLFHPARWLFLPASFQQPLLLRAHLPCSVQSMRLGKGDEVVAMAILPAGIAPEASMDEEDEEARAAAAAASLGEEDEVAEGGADAAGPCLLIVTEQGLGKRCLISEFRLRSRTCMGVRAALLNPGDRLAAVQVVGAGATAPPRGSDTDTDEQKSAGNDTDVLLSTEQGQLVRVPIHGLRLLARATKGSKLVKVREGDRVLAATVLSNRK